jgi:phosphoribosylamine--glycine ligase
MPSPKILIVGSGGREHALAWGLANSPHQPEILGLPGNPGVAELGRCLGGDPMDADRILDVVREQRIDLTVIGPEAPLVAGLANTLRSEGFAAFGPDESAARIEGSKVFAKTLMRDEGVPTPAFEIFIKPHEALDYIKRQLFPIVIKVDGLAAGKGAFICKTLDECKEVLDRILVAREFGEAGQRLIVEKHLVGEEMSCFVLTNGKDSVLLPTAQDYKRVGEGDTGPNTGGMGATSPVVNWTPDLERRVKEEVVQPVLRALERTERPYRGLLYVGLMIADGLPSVLEFNCRFGDPETQVILPLIEGDLLQALMWGAGVDSTPPDVRPSAKAAATIVLTSGGYPGSYTKGYPITGVSKARELPNALVFHAGTAWAEIGPGGRGEGDFHPSPEPFGGATSAEGSLKGRHRLVTAGGRVLNAVGIGDDVKAALRRAYEVASLPDYQGRYYRKDIGHRALASLREKGS